MPKFKKNTSSFKMKGSPLNKNKQWYVDNYETHKNKPGFLTAMNKAFGGKTTVEGKKSITRKPQ